MIVLCHNNRQNVWCTLLSLLFTCTNADIVQHMRLLYNMKIINKAECSVSIDAMPSVMNLCLPTIITRRICYTNNAILLLSCYHCQRMRCKMIMRPRQLDEWYVHLKALQSMMTRWSILVELLSLSTDEYLKIILRIKILCQYDNIIWNVWGLWWIVCYHYSDHQESHTNFFEHSVAELLFSVGNDIYKYVTISGCPFHLSEWWCSRWCKFQG